MKLLYHLFIRLYPFGARILSLTNEKARKWINGRKDIFRQLEDAITHEKKIAWVHCASLGEFEQARPLMEELPKQFPGIKILLTFFSPSGYEVQKNYQGADHVFYLPMDAKKNAAKFFDIVQPSLVIFIKYEFWYYYLNEAKTRNIPVLLVSGIFRLNQPFFQSYGKFHKKMLGFFSYFFVQDENSLQLLHSIGIQNVVITGDTRFDRVLAIAGNFRPIPLVEAFCGNHPVIVAGSTWTDDDEELDHYANTNQHIRFIIAPHDISNARINECLTLYKNAITFSELNSTPDFQLPTSNVLIIDNIGMLSKLYHYATICYVGGGFGADGVHNVLEAAVYNKPVVFGPEYDKYIEAEGLVECGGAFSIECAVTLEKQLNELLDDEVLYKQASIAAGAFVKENGGATAKVINYIQEKRLFTT